MTKDHQPPKEYLRKPVRDSSTVFSGYFTVTLPPQLTPPASPPDDNNTTVLEQPSQPSTTTISKQETPKSTSRRLPHRANLKQTGNDWQATSIPRKLRTQETLQADFNLWQNFIGTNVLTKFHEDWPINVANIDNCPPPPPGGHVFQQTITIFKPTQAIVRTNVQIKFHKDWIINVTSRVKNATPPCNHVFKLISTIFELSPDIIMLTRKTARPHGGHVFHSTGTIFELVQDFIGTHVLTKFHEDWTKNVTSRVLTRKTATPPGGHVFQPTGTIFKYHWTKNVTSRVLTRKTATPPGGHVFQPTGTIFELVQDIIGTHVLTKFHEDRTINVTSRQTATPPGGHVFQSTGTIFELVQDIIGTHVLSNVNKVNVDNAQCTTHDGQKAITIAHHEHVVLR
ncbi:hypothetical protein DPMN_154965 [Dreissena polymorpha]|uniref:Uncharacterized protein n=1 Tax=Dreissena polymorpha TaxID=45954 RepID=A0A9D4FSV8_DREPO|nr:hypothetical protein DPMN_154965 [Dreissena polymorpha]